MSESPRNLEFHEAVRNQIRILDDIFDNVGVPGIFENPDVTFDPYWCVEHYLKFKLFRSNGNSVALDFHLAADGMRLDFENYDEAWDISISEINRDNLRVKEILERLITCPILVEYKGRALFVNLFNRDGSRFDIWGLQSYSALICRGYWKPQSINQHLFSPIYAWK
jgi:hypothetical protein